MAQSPTAALPFVQHCFEQFQNAYQHHNYGLAYASMVQALLADAGIAFPYFMARASAAIDATLRNTGCAARMAEWLDELLSQHPHMNLLCDVDPALAQRLLELRECNIKKRLPSIVLVAQGKSASISVARIFNCGFDLPSFAYSLVTVEVIESWARDYARGGTCYTTHLQPRPENIARLKRAGIDKIIVHLRDPRQSLLSMIHHVMRYPDDVPLLSQNGFHRRTIAQQIDEMSYFYMGTIRWILGWIDAEGEMEVMFSTFEDYVKDRDKFVERYLDFYGGPREYFSYDEAVAVQAGTDYHFRAGLVDEWRSAFPTAQAKRLSAWLPDGIKRRFGWPD